MKRTLSVKSMALIAMLSAIAVLLMLLRIPIPFIAPSFYKLDLSELPVLIGAFAMGPFAGVVIEFLKILLNLLFNGTDSAYIGELANFLMGCAFVLPAGLIYKYVHNRKGAYIAIATGCVTLSVAAALVNAFLLLPWYADHFFASAGGMDAILSLGAKIHPSIGTLTGFTLLCVLPFNLLKGILTGALTALLYKRVSFLIHNFRGDK